MLAGCGGLSHGAFVKRADAVCSAYAAGAQPLPKPTRYAQVVAYVDRNLPLYEAALRKLEALKPPAQDRAAVQQWLAADRRVAAALQSARRGCVAPRLSRGDGGDRGPAVRRAREQPRGGHRRLPGLRAQP